MRFLLEHWKKLAPRDRKALTICFSFLAVIGFYLGALEPLLDTYEDAVQQKTVLEQSIRQNLPKVQVLPIRMAQLKRARAEYDYLVNRLSLAGPNAWNLSEVYHEIRVYASTTGVSIRDIRPMTRRKAGFMSGLPLEVSFQGNYKDIVKFIYYLETSPQVLVLSRLSLSGEKPPLSGTIVVNKVELPSPDTQITINRESDLILTVAPWNGFAPFQYAKKEGALSTDSTHVEFYFSQYESTSFDMLIANEIDGTAAPTLDLIKLLLQGVDLKVVAPLAYYNVTETLFTAPESDIETLEDLRGRDIYLEKDSVAHFLLYKILKKNRMKLSDLRVHDMDRMVVAQSLSAGIIEAGITSYPFASQLMENNEAEVLVSPEDWQRNILLLLCFRSDALPGKDEAMNSLLKAYFTIAEKWRKNPELAVSFIGRGATEEEYLSNTRKQMAQVRYLSPDEIREMICPRPSDSDLRVFLNDYKDFLNQTLGYELKFPIDELVDWSYIRKIFECPDSPTQKPESGG